MLGDASTVDCSLGASVTVTDEALGSEFPGCKERMARGGPNKPRVRIPVEASVSSRIQELPVNDNGDNCGRDVETGLRPTR